MMNKAVFAVLFCLISLSTLSAESNDPILVKSSVNESTVNLQLANLEGERTTVKFYSLDTGTLIWTNSVKAHNGYSYKLSLADMDFGRYYFEIIKGDVVKKQVVLVNENGVALSGIK